MALVQCPCAWVDMTSDAMHSPCLSAVLLARVLVSILFWLNLEPSGLVTCQASPLVTDDDAALAADVQLFVDGSGAPTGVTYLLLSLAALAGNSAWNGRVWTLVGATAAFLQLGLFASYDVSGCFADLDGLGIVGAAVASVFLLYDVVAVLLYAWVLLAWVFGCGDFPKTPCCRLEASRPQPMYDGGGCCRSDGCIADCGRGRVPLPAFSAVVGRTAGIVEDYDPVTLQLRRIAAGSTTPVEVEPAPSTAASPVRCRAVAASPATTVKSQHEITGPVSDAAEDYVPAPVPSRPGPASAPPSGSSTPLPVSSRDAKVSETELGPLIDEGDLSGARSRQYGTPGPEDGFVAQGRSRASSALRGEATKDEGELGDADAAGDVGGEGEDAAAGPVVWHTPAVVGAWRLVQIPSRLWLGVFASLTVSLSVVGIMAYIAWLLTIWVEGLTAGMQQIQQKLMDSDDETAAAQLELSLLLLLILVPVMSALWKALVAAGSIMATAAIGSAVWHLVRFRVQAESLARVGHCDASPLSKMRAAGINPNARTTADKAAVAAAGGAAGACAAQLLGRMAVFLEPDALVPAAMWQPLWRRIRPPPENASPEATVDAAELEEAGAVELAAIEAMEESAAGDSPASGGGGVAVGPAVCASPAHASVAAKAGGGSGRAARVSTALSLKHPAAGAVPPTTAGQKKGAGATAMALTRQAAAAARRTVALTRLALRRKHRWSARPIGFLHDIPLSRFPSERATSFVGAYTANVLVSAALLGIAMFVLTFLLAFEPTRDWIVNLIVAQLIVLGLRTVQRIVFRWFIVGREGPSRLRCFACCDATVSLTSSAVSGLFTGLSRVLLIALINLIFSLRVDAPLIPSVLATLDAGFVSWAAMVRTRADAEAFGPDKDATLARWCCIPRPLEVDVDEPWETCPRMRPLGCGTGGAVRSPAESTGGVKGPHSSPKSTGPQFRASV